ncbi:MAG TPA: hypothetical protein VEX63_05655 [Flavisolibacter sp.]|jgi:hypothetical protein|nr:hypothetical protein [Flavisolibacter sp.]
MLLNDSFEYLTDKLTVLTYSVLQPSQLTPIFARRKPPSMQSLFSSNSFRTTVRVLALVIMLFVLVNMFA